MVVVVSVIGIVSWIVVKESWIMLSAEKMRDRNYEQYRIWFDVVNLEVGERATRALLNEYFFGAGNMLLARYEDWGE